jgi:hypothetical protein
MQDPKILILISNHLSSNQSVEEKEVFLAWLNESKKNQTLFNEIKRTWKEEPLSFREKLTKENIIDIFIQQILGNLVGFAVGLWVTNTFTHYVTEKRSLKNLFGMAGRKKIVVNETPEWVQYSLSFILGFIALELINYFFQTKKHLLIWNFTKERYLKYKSDKK